MSQMLQDRIRLLHEWYCAAMGTKLPLDMASERYWFDWCQAGFNGQQLRKVMVYLRRQIADGKRNHGSLKLRNLINVENFGADLMLCSAKLDPELKLPPSLPSERL